jgi:polyisoprenoid-binding protein YceI
MRAFLMVLAAALAPLPAAAAEFVVKPGGENKVVFVSQAPIETFEGHTNRMQGRIVVDPAGVTDSITVHLEVDLASLDTGIAKRNMHMRENHLETTKYPRAVFDGAAIASPSGARLEAGRPLSFDVEGTFSLHGVSRRLRIKAEVTYAPQPAGARLTFRTTFPVNLTDYAIRRPEFLFMKLAETQTVKVTGVAFAAP